MKLNWLLEALAGEQGIATGIVPDIEVTGVTADSRTVRPGMMFVCIKGEKVDGHDLAQAALEAGAVWILCSRPLGTGRETVSENTRRAFGLLCGRWWGNPGDKMQLIGVTGTNGKTSTAYMIKSVLESVGHKVGLIGTVQTEIGDLAIPARYTTPDPFVLHSILSRMEQGGCSHAVMECSSHALAQERLAGLTFAVSVFTNLSQDHLDYHGTMEEYFRQKRKLFAQSRRGVICLDDRYGRQLAQEAPCPVRTYSIQSDEADYTAKNLELTDKGSKFIVVGKGEIARVRLSMLGSFSAANAVGAAVACRQMGLTLEDVAEALGRFPGVTGRGEVIEAPADFTVLRDYAHTPDGLEKIITSVRAFAKKRVVTLFGCAGNRDRAKRALMGEAAARLSDFVILTSDNPRDEDEQQIIQDAMPGLEKYPKTPRQVIPDRFEAIHWALEHAKPGDVLILAGKGHEDYQVLKGETVAFDEKEIVLSYFAQTKERSK